MGKRRREAESDSAMPSTAEYNTVFVDTSLDTHLAMLVSDSDTVLDFKRKLMQEHAKCFPNNGEIWIHSLKVKRKRNFYHLPDFMLVCSALHGLKGNWFLSADASGLLECYINQKASECDRKDHCGVISSDANKILNLTMSLPDGVTEENIVSGMAGGQKVEKYSERTAEFWRTDSLQNSLTARSPAKKKRKMKYHEVVLPSPTLENHSTQFHASGEETLHPVLTGCRIDVAEETPKIMPDCVEETAEDAGVRYDPSNMECRGVVVGPSIVATVTGASKQKKISKRKKKLPHDQVIEMAHSSDYCKGDKSFISNTAVYAGNVNLSELSGIPEDECDNNNEASCPLKGKNMKEPENCHSAIKVDNLNQLLEIKVKEKASYSTNAVHIIDGKDKETDQLDIDDEQKVSSQNHDQVLLQSDKLGTLDRHEAHGNTMESVPADDYPGSNEEMGCGSRSKTKAKKSGGKICYDADGELSENVMHLAPLTSRSLELNTLKHYETARTDIALCTAYTDLNVGNKKDRGMSVNQQSDLNQSELDVCAKEANSSAKLMDANGALEGIKSIGNNSKKKRTQKAAAIFQDISDVELKTKKSGSTELITRSSKSRKKDEKRELSINHHLEVMLPSYNNISASADPVITPKICSPSGLLDTNNLEESEISGNSRKKKVKKFADSNLGKSAVKQTGRKAVNQPDLVEEQREVFLSHDPVPIEFEKLGTSDWHEEDGNIRESAQPNSFSCTVGEMGYGFKKKKMAKKSRSKILDETDGEHSDNGIHLTPIAAPNLDLKLLNDPETKRTYSILPTAEIDLDVRTKQDGNLLVSHKIGMSQPEAGVAIIEPKLPSRLIHSSGASEDTHNNHDKRKKKKTKKSAGKIEDTSYLVNEPQKAIGDDALHHDLEVMPLSSSKALECVDPELKSNGAGVTTKLLDVNMVVELKTSKGHRRKQSVKKSANTVMGKLDPAYNGTRGSSAVLLCSQTDHFPEETDKGENISVHKVQDVQMKMLDDSAADSERKVGDATIKKSNSMKLTQTTKDVSLIHLTPIAAPNLDLKLLNDPETKKTYSILPTAEIDLDVGTKQDGNLLASHEIGTSQPEAGVAIIEPKLPSRLIHSSGASDDTHNNHDKMRKKKTKKSAGKIEDTSYRVNEPQKAIGDDALHHDLEVMPPSSSKALDCVDPELKSNGAGVATKLLDVNMVEELKTSKGHRRKQSVKKSANTVMGKLDPAYNGTSGSSAVLLCSQTDHFPEETDKGENISVHKVQDVQMKMLDDSAADSERRVGNATIIESNSMKLTQTTKDVGICEQRMEKKDHNSAGDCLPVPSVIENQMNSLEPNRAQNSIEIARVKDKKAKKKTKEHLIASDCLENILIKEQEVGVEEHSTVEKANNFLEFEQECQNVEPRVLSHKREKNLGEIQFTAASTDLVRHVEDKDEGVNFKLYFLSGQKQDKAAYVDKVKKAIKSSEEMKTVKKIKKRGLPSVSTSTELHNSAKLSENKDGKDKSHVRCSTNRKDGDFAVSLKVSDNGMIDSSPTEMRGMTTLKKHNENTVASPLTKDKNTPFDKSCLERSVRGNERRQSGLDESDKVVVKTTRKNSLFAKVGSLFQDCSGESYSDENRTANSDASTCSPSDSSSQSGCSAGESELSQGSARNGSNDAQGRVTREENNAKLDLSASNEMTLDMILRSSKRFKKAKLIASQNELEQIDSQLEFVPDSQTINE